MFSGPPVYHDGLTEGDWGPPRVSAPHTPPLGGGN